MGRKPDQKQVDAVADEFDMTEEERFGFGDYLEECKARGDRGTKNDRGDFSWIELKSKARELLCLPEDR